MKRKIVCKGDEEILLVEFLFLDHFLPFRRFYEKNSFDEPTKQINDAQVESTVRFQRRVAFVFWSFFIIFWTYCTISFIKLKFYVLLVCLFHLILDQFANGLIDFVCQLNENQLRRAHPAIKQE